MRKLSRFDKVILVLVSVALGCVAGCGSAAPDEGADAASRAETAGDDDNAEPEQPPLPEDVKAVLDEKPAPDDPRREVKTAIEYALALLEKEDYKTFAMKMLPPEQLKQQAAVGKLSQMFEFLRDNPDEREQLESSLRQALDKEPSYIGDDLAIFRFEESQDSVVIKHLVSFTKADETWRLGQTRANREARIDTAAELRKNMLREIGIAVEKYYEAHGSFPRSSAAEGQGLLSWRVHLLPYLDHTLLGKDKDVYRRLYQRFRLDEPWDSEHNRKLLREIPPVFVEAELGSPSEGTTRVVALSGPGSVLAGPEAVTWEQIPDGLSKTALAAVAASDRAVPWTSPADPVADAAQPSGGLGRTTGRIAALFADGGVRELDASLAAEELVARFHRSDGK